MQNIDSWIILCHENPDGDTLGCGLALYSLGRQLGKKVRVCGKDVLPLRYEFLPNSHEYEVLDSITDKIAADALVLCVDTSTAERSVCGIDDISVAACTVNIDHHADNTKYCRLNLVDASASATAEIVEKIITLSWCLTKETAMCLYVALSTDNGNFRFSSTTPQSHLCASELLKNGVDPSYVDDCVNENMTQETLKLWGLAYSRTEIFAEGKAAIFWLTDADFNACKSDASAADGLVNMLLRIRGVKVALLLSGVNGKNKASIRTRRPYSAREIASAFGGGGHVQAAGAKIQGTFEDSLAILKTEADKYVCCRNTSTL